jgi:hypothetical protein
MIYSEDKGAIRPDNIEHVIVYRKNDEYAGWPFNGGFWHFGNGELLLVLTAINALICRLRMLDIVKYSWVMDN